MVNFKRNCQFWYHKTLWFPKIDKFLNFESNLILPKKSFHGIYRLIFAPYRQFKNLKNVQIFWTYFEYSSKLCSEWAIIYALCHPQNFTSETVLDSFAFLLLRNATFKKVFCSPANQFSCSTLFFLISSATDYSSAHISGNWSQKNNFVIKVEIYFVNWAQLKRCTIGKKVDLECWMP